MEKQAYSINEFCAVHGICRSTYYNLVEAGDGPVTMRIKKRVLITVESAAKWRHQMEEKTSAL